MLSNTNNFNKIVSPFEKCKELHSKIEQYEFNATTKEKVQMEADKRFKELEDKYGVGFVRNEPHILTYVKDSNGKIVGWTIKGKFVCYIPEKNKNKEDRIK